MKWVSMAEQPHRSLRSPCAMPNVGWSGVKLAATGVMNHGSPSGIGGCQENATFPNAQWRRNNGLGLVLARPLISSEGKS